MRPDKKGNKKRDERRNGPKTGSQKPTAAQKTSGPVKPSAPQQLSTAPPKQTACVGGAAAGEKPASAQGPRVLEPVAPPPDTTKYRRREIRSNWGRYEEEPTDEPAPDEDFLRGDTFAELLAVSATGAGHFHLKSERSWLEEGGTSSQLLTLDVYRVAAALGQLPLHQRLDIDIQHFTEEELAQFALEAETCSAASAAAVPPAETDRPAQPDTTSAAAGDPVTSCPPLSDATKNATSSEGDLKAEPVRPSNHVTEAPPQSTPSPAANAAAGPATGTDDVIRPTGTGDVIKPAAVGNVIKPAVAGTGDVSRPTCTGDVIKPAAAAAAAVPPPATSSLLQDDWLDSVLSDED